jgi:hypothetical protein
MRIPRRIERQQGLHSLVDGIPFTLPVDSSKTPALMAAFTIDADKARLLLPGKELHPFRLWGNRGLLIITVVDYQITDIGNYIEYSIAIACTHGERAAPPLLPGLLPKLWGTGQYVVDLPVSTEISVKGGKGIWGMPKHQANLDFKITDDRVWSQYDLDGQLCMRVEVKRPRFTGIPLGAAAVNYCQFRGMLMKSYIYFRGRAGIQPPFSRSAKLTVGDHPRMAGIKALDPAERPIMTAFFPETRGVLDDHFEGWFLAYDKAPAESPEGLESVVGLGHGRDWLPPPNDPLVEGNGATSAREVARG